MISLGYKAFVVVTGGVLIGTVGAMHVNPVPKQPEPQWWQLTGQSNVAVDPSSAGLWVEAGPGDLYVPRQDSYAPDWADDGDIWRYEAPELPEWEPDPLFAQYDVPPAPEPAVPAESALVAADRADQAAAEAQEAQTLAAAEPAAPDGHQSDLAMAGLY